MIAMTTSSSMRVNPNWGLICFRGPKIPVVHRTQYHKISDCRCTSIGRFWPGVCKSSELGAFNRASLLLLPESGFMVE